jgi:hypothetical protein
MKLGVPSGAAALPLAGDPFAIDLLSANAYSE